MLTLRARRVFDGRDLLHDQVVTVRDGRVTSVAPGRTADVDPDIDLGEATLLPGLIDAHVHLAFDAGPDVVDRVTRLGDEELLEVMRDSAGRQLAAGVTTVRDLGDRGFLALRLGLGVNGPEVLAAGPPITSPRGHCWFLGGEAAGEEQVRQAVRERARRGAHVVKMMLTGGELTPGTHSHRAQFTAAEAKAAAEEAHVHGLPIAGHAHGREGIVLALEAGFDTVEHCSFLTEDSAEADPAVVARLAASSAIASLTLGFVPGAGEPPPRMRRLLPKLSEVLRTLGEAGVTYVIGSDAGIGPPKPHGVLPWGAQMAADLGFEPIDVLRAMTSRAALACRVADRKGHIAPGYDADLLVVDGDPLADVAALRRPVAVYRMGTRVGP
ncbi:amidohydrolase family protein [Thermoactinospora rubra]|uniref:amidohydrolase family protein n=1 Tax=Thermoactinospora rubra TaxID=1088767 RepID=UPI000A1225B8|nr:amidohydrolase family protein [Thermoactinospora rubra]